MSNVSSILRSLVVYGLCLPLAVFLGYLLAMPMDVTSFTIVFLALFLPLVPVLLRWHHLLLLTSWNMSVVLFFLPGRPSLWIVMAALSLALSILQHILNRNVKFVPAPSVARPLIFLALVILITARLTGGIGMSALGSETYGGKRYVLVLGAIIAYFALTCHPIPRTRAIGYAALFFLGGLTSLISSVGPLLDPSLYFIFLIFPVESLQAHGGGGLTLPGVYQRFGGVAVACMAAATFILARHGVRGVLNFNERWCFLPLRFRGGLAVNHPWRILLLLAFVWTSLWMGGFRGAVIFLAILLFCQFFLEGLYRTPLLPVLLLLGIVVASAGLPLASKLPLTVQRSISFLPVPIDPVARYDAEASSEWRLRMWRTLWPQVPQYLLLGKGYGINPSELAMARSLGPDTGEEGSIIVGDYHNGPLSVVIPLGIYGVIGFLWFLAASVRVLYNNCRYGDPELQTINNFLLAVFIAHIIMFFAVFGSLYNELVTFTGLIGLNISLNGGVRKPAPVAAQKPAFNQFKLARAAP